MLSSASSLCPLCVLGGLTKAAALRKCRSLIARGCSVGLCGESSFVFLAALAVHLAGRACGLAVVVARLATAFFLESKAFGVVSMLLAVFTWNGVRSRVMAVQLRVAAVQRRVRLYFLSDFRGSLRRRWGKSRFFDVTPYFSKISLQFRAKAALLLE